MVRTLLVRGMLVGVVGAALVFIFASVFAEPQITAAVAFEYAHSTSDGGAELVSRSVQSTLGLGLAIVLYGTALGGLFALAFAFVHGRFGWVPARVTSVLVAATGFVGVYLAPFLKYPANPPAIGEPDTIGRRTILYLIMVVISVLAAVVAALAGRGWAGRLGRWNATLVAVGVFVLVVAVAAAILPNVDEVPDSFPASVLWRFRVASVGAQLVLWATFGLLFAALTDRAERPAGRDRRMGTDRQTGTGGRMGPDRQMGARRGLPDAGAEDSKPGSAP
jgi:predicted cobalt transporter CbtA